MTDHWLCKSILSIGIILPALLWMTTTTHAGPVGIYVQIAAGDTLPTSTEWQVPFVSGFNVPRQWKTLEPSLGVYNWSDFDQLIAAAATYGKRVMIGVRTGLFVDSGSDGTNTGVPMWYAGQTYTCSNGDVGPIPYDPAFVEDLTALYAAMIARYDSLDVVAGYGLSAWQQWAYYEMGPPCRNTATPSDLQGLIAPPYGYTRQQIENTML